MGRCINNFDWLMFMKNEREIKLNAFCIEFYLEKDEFFRIKLLNEIKLDVFLLIIC